MQPGHKRSTLNRLKTVRGPLDAVIAMVDEELYCPDISRSPPSRGPSGKSTGPSSKTKWKPA